MEGLPLTIGTILLVAASVVGLAALLHATYHLVVLLRRSAEWAERSSSASGGVPPDVAAQRRRVARSVAVFALAWLAVFGVLAFAPGLLGLD